MHSGGRGNRRQYPSQGRHLEKGRSADQTQLHLAFLCQVDQADLQARRLERQLGQGQGKADQYPGQQVAEDNRQGRHRVSQHRHAPVAPQAAKDLEVHQLEAGVDQHPRQARHRNALQHVGQHQHETQQPQAMENRRITGLGPGLDIGRAAHDDTGHGQGTQQTAEHVAHALGRQFTVEVRALAAVHAIHRGGGEQGFGTGDKGHGEGGDQQVGVRQVEQVGGAQPVDGLGQVGRHLDALHRQRQQQAGQGRQPDTEQGTGDEPQRLGPPLVPAPHHRDSRQPQQASLPPQARQGLRQSLGKAHKVIQARGLGRGIEHHMHLGQHDQHADARQHAVDHRWRRDPEPATQAQAPGQQLQQPGQQQDRPEHGHPMLAHQLEHQHRQPGRRPADLQGRARQPAHHQATDDPGDQALGRRQARGNGDPHAQGQGHQKHHHRSQQLPWQDTFQLCCTHDSSPDFSSGVAKPGRQMAALATTTQGD